MASEQLPASGAALREYLDTLRAGMEALACGLALLDRDGTLLCANRVWQDTGGDGCREGENYLEGLRRQQGRDAHAGAVLAGLEALLSGRETAFRYEYTDGRGEPPRWFLLLANPLDAPLAGMMVNRVDITAQKQTELALREEEARYRALAEFASDMISRHTLEGVFLYASPACRTLLGYAPEELVGRDIFDLIHPDELDSVRAAHDRMLADHCRGLAVYRIRHRSGHYLWFETQCGLIQDGRGAPSETLAISRDVTERVRAEAVLRESEQRYRLLFERAHDAIMMVDIETGLLLDANPRAERMLGRPREAIIGLHHTELTPPETREYHEQSFRNHAYIDGKIPAIVEFMHADGHLIPLEIHHSPVRIGERMVGYGFFRDLSEALKTEKALRDSEMKYRTLMENAGDAILVSDMAGYLKDMNRTAERLLGYDRSELVGVHASFIHPPEEAGTLAAAFQDMNARGRSRYEHKVRRKDGSLLTVEVIGVRIHHGDEQVAMGIFRDLSERIRAEEALRQSESRFRILAENLQEVVWLSAPDFSACYYVSPAITPLLGLSPEDLYRDPAAWMSLILPEDREGVGAGLEAQGRGQPAEAEFRIRGPDGEIRWMWARSFPTRDSQGAPLAAGVLEDVTLRRHAEEVRLNEAMRQRDTLVREVHHRIKNHLQGVAGLLRQHGREHPEVSAVMELAVHRIQSVSVVYGLQSRAGDVALCDMVEAIAHNLEEYCPEGLRTQVRTLDQRPFLISDAEAVAAALIVNELIMNAIKYADPPRGMIAVSVDGEGGRARIRITNPGALPPGFAFPSGMGLGTGLGLVRALLPQQGARIEYSQAEGRVAVLFTLDDPIIKLRSPTHP